jgi:hypothetical protein
MTVPVTDVLSEVRTLLIDNGSAPRWSDNELCDYVMDAERSVMAIYPASTARRFVLPLQMGSRQVMASNVHTLLTIIRNCDVTGEHPGRAVRLAMREQLDAFNPGWHTDKPSDVAQSYIYDPSETAFYVYPPNTGNGYVDVLYSQIPPHLDPAVPGAALAVRDIYKTPVIDFVLFRAHSKDADYAGGLGVAGTFLQSFTQFMGANSQKILENNPNQQSGPPNMAVQGAAK